MTDLQAALGIHQLRRLESNLEVRERHWRRYNEAFAGMAEVATPRECGAIRHARHCYTLQLQVERLEIDRNGFLCALRRRNIGAGVHYVALHLHPYYRDTFGYRRGDFPNAEHVSDRTLSLPLSAKLSDDDVEDVIAAVKATVREFAVA